MVNLLRDGQPLRMSKRAGTVVTHRRPRRRDRRRRQPLRPGALSHRQPASTSTSTCGPRPPTTTRSSPCNTHMRGWRPDAATPPTWAGAPGRSTPSCSSRRRRASCCVRSPSSRGWSAAPPSCASRTGWRATSRHRGGLPPVLRHLPGAATGDEEHRRPPPGAPRAGRTPRATVLANGLACSASPLPSGCERACPPHTRPAGRTLTAPCAGPRGCASPPTPTRSSRTSGRARPRRPTACSASAAWR